MRWFLTTNKIILALLTALSLIGEPRVKLSGEWVATIYSQDFIGKKHGAYWNGFKCKGIDGQILPDEVTETDLALAMPGAEFYCLQVVICHQNKCVKAIAVDVPKDHRLADSNGKLYSHLDLYPALAKELGIDGLQYGDLEVYLK